MASSRERITEALVQHQASWVRQKPDERGRLYVYTCMCDWRHEGDNGDFEISHAAHQAEAVLQALADAGVIHTRGALLTPEQEATHRARRQAAAEEWANGAGRTPTVEQMQRAELRTRARKDRYDPDYGNPDSQFYGVGYEDPDPSPTTREAVRSIEERVASVRSAAGVGYEEPDFNLLPHPEGPQPSGGRRLVPADGYDRLRNFIREVRDECATRAAACDGTGVGDAYTNVVTMLDRELE